MKQKECKWYQVCPIKFYTDQEKLNDCWVNEYCHGNWDNCLRYQKEEAGIYHPDNLLPDGTYFREEDKDNPKS
ncbi:MAG: uracil-DNA glycosylase [Candidatus Aminicenantes bacterium]|nr:uracil-DNA glycosylase [Candidatus Aminicenantes bacterium]